MKLMAKPLDFSCDATEIAKPDLYDASQIVLTHLILDLMSVCSFRKRMDGIPQV